VLNLGPQVVACTGGDGDSTFIVFGRLKTFDGDDEN
jgi:hypothetical protein